MATYSINIGTPTESTKVQDLQTFLNKLPDNTAQLISPRDTRDAIFTTWENILIKETTVAASSIGYIGLSSDTLKAAMLIGKRSYTTQDTLDDTLLNSDTDLFIFNGKSDSNPSLQDTKISLLAGIVPSDYPFAPYMEATKIIAPSRIDLSIVNPATAGVIQINADQIELGDNGWIINDTGALYPVVDGQDLGATPSNRIGNIYMASRIDYGSDLLFTVGDEVNMVLETGGTLSIDSISASKVFTDNLQVTTSATAGFILVSDGIGNTIWEDNFASSAGADGSVQFSNSGLLTSDIANFYWDNFNKRLGLGTNLPTTELDVIGSGSFSSNLRIAGNLVASGSFIFATAGFGVGKALMSDSSGIASWETLITATGPTNSIQLTDGSDNVTTDSNFFWDTNYGGSVLRVGTTVDVGESSGAGIQTSGDLRLEKDSFFGINTYYNGSYKRIGNDYSSWFKQEGDEFTLNLGTTGSAGSTISSTNSVTILNDNGYVGLNITPERQLHLSDSMRIEPISATPSGATQGDIHCNTLQNDLLVHDSDDWYKVSNKDIYQIDAFNMFVMDGETPEYDGEITEPTVIKVVNNITYTRQYQTGSWEHSLVNFILPDSYINGRDLEVTINYFVTETVIGEIVTWKLGYNTIDADAYNAIMTYGTSSKTFTSVDTNPNLKNTITISSSKLLPNNHIGLVLMRDTSDTFGDTVNFVGITVKMA